MTPSIAMLSNRCEYGLRAAFYLAHRNTNEYVSIGSISDELGISFPFLTKVLQELKDHRLLESRRGPKGGVRFAKSPTTITLRDVIVAIDGPALFEECVLGLPGCGDEKPCPLHDHWGEQRDQLEALYTHTTLADVADEIERSDVRLAESSVLNGSMKTGEQHPSH